MQREDNKVLIVAEFTTNHGGDMTRLMEMVHAAKASGADLIKIQKRDVETFYSDDQLEVPYNSPFGSTLRDYRKAIELSVAQIEEFDRECRKEGIEWFATILDLNSFHALRPFGKPLLKIPSTISEHHDFHAEVAKLHTGPIVVSTGFTSKEYEVYVEKRFSGNEKIYLLQANSAYPTPPKDCGIAVVRHYTHLSRTNTKIVPGYSSHDEGSLGCMMAVAAGARMIEKHVKFGSTPWIHYDNVAIDLSTDEFANFVQDIRKAEAMCGSEQKEIKKSEHHKYSVVKRN